MMNSTKSFLAQRFLGLASAASGDAFDLMLNGTKCTNELGLDGVMLKGDILGVENTTKKWNIRYDRELQLFLLIHVDDRVTVKAQSPRSDFRIIDKTIFA